jgi:hypothetical protein
MFFQVATRCSSIHVGYGNHIWIRFILLAGGSEAVGGPPIRRAGSTFGIDTLLSLSVYEPQDNKHNGKNSEVADNKPRG